MQFVGILGLIALFTGIALIDQPKIAAQARKRKYAAVYYTVLALGLCLSILDIFNVVPDYDKIIIHLYQNLFGQKS